MIDSVERNKLVFEIASLAAGGAITTAEIALNEPAFGIIRPPGHHAGRGFNGGFCFFNNIAVAMQKLVQEKKIDKALIVDIDLHYGRRDGAPTLLVAGLERSRLYALSRANEQR